MNFADKLHDLNTQIKECEQVIEDTQNEINQQEADGIPHVGTYNGIKNKLEKAKETLASLQAEKAELEGAAETAQSELTSEFDDIGGTGLSLRALSSSEEAYQVISIYLKQKIGDMVEQHAAVVHSYKGELATLSETVNELSKIKGEYEAFYRENIELSDKLADMEAKRDAAGRELEAFKAENERLKEDNSKLREQLENKSTSRNDQTLDDLKSYAEKIKAKQIPIYNKRWENDLKRTHVLANLAETNEEIRIPYLELGKYREIEGEELARFQEELEEKKQAELAQEPVQLAPSLPIPQLPQDAEVPAYPVSGEVAPEAATVTREEFEVLKKDVERIKYELGHMNIAI